MLINEFNEDAKVNIIAYSNNSKAEFNTRSIANTENEKLIKILEKKYQMPVAILEPIYLEEKEVGFQNVKLNVFITNDKQCFLYTDVKLTTVKTKDNEKYLILISSQNVKSYNRRQTFRVWVGLSGRFSINANGTIYNNLIKDISSNGLGMLVDNEVKINVGDKVNIAFKDDTEEDKNYSFSIIAEVLRIDEIPEKNNKLVAVKFLAENHLLNKYISKKQRSRVALDRKR